MPSVYSPKACFKECGKKDSKQCRGKGTALLHATKDVEGVGSGTIVQNCSLHVTMKGFHDTEYGRKTTNLGQVLKRPSLLTRSNALVRSIKAT